MRKHEVSQEGFKPNLNYDRFVTRPVKKHQWRKFPEGRGAIILLGLIGDTLTGPSIEIERNFSKQGASRRALYHELVSRCPWIPAWYNGEFELSEDIVYDRYHKMYYWNDAPTRQERGQRSREHYLSDPKLRPFVPAVETLFKRGGIITKEQMTQAMTNEKLLSVSGNNKVAQKTDFNGRDDSEYLRLQRTGN